MLVGRRGELGVAVVLAEEDDRQPPHGGEVHRLVERALGHRAVAEERHRDAAVGPQLRRRRRARRRSGRPAATMPLAPKIPRVGSAMCIEPPAAAVGALVLGHQLGEHPERVQALGQAVAVAAVGRGDDVGGPERPAGADGGRLLPDRQVHEAGHLAVAVERGHPLLEPADHQHPPVHLEQVVGGSHRPCIVLVGTTTGRGDDRADRDPRAPCPGRGDVRGKRVVLTGAGRGLGRLLAHAFSQAGALVALVARTEADLKDVAAELPGPSLVLQRRRDRRGLQRGGRRRHRGRVGRRRRVDLQRRDLARSWPARSRPSRRSGARCSR